MIGKRAVHCHISIHALREESDVPGGAAAVLYLISIHALREESDHVLRLCAIDAIISIHALREESDIIAARRRTWTCLFQSTLSVRRATSILTPYSTCSHHFNPRSP